MKLRPVIYLLACFVLLAFAWPALADDEVQGLRDEIANYNTSNPHQCPRGPERARYSCDEMEKEWKSTWGPTVTKESSDAGDRYVGCLRRIEKLNSVVNEYNNLLESCRPNQKNEEAAQAKKEQLRKAAADAKRQKEEDAAVAKAQSIHKLEDLEVQRAQAEKDNETINTLATTRTKECLSVISDCEHYVNDPSAKKTAIQPCRQYCEKLKTTSCDTMNDDLHTLAQICRLRATADRLDQQHVAERMRQVQAQIDQDRRQRQNDEEQQQQNAAFRRAIDAIVNSTLNRAPQGPIFKPLPNIPSPSSGRSYPKDWAPSGY